MNMYMASALKLHADNVLEDMEEPVVRLKDVLHDSHQDIVDVQRQEPLHI